MRKMKEKQNPCGLDLNYCHHGQPIVSFILRKEKEKKKILHLCLLKIYLETMTKMAETFNQDYFITIFFYLSNVGSLEKQINPGSVAKYKVGGKYSACSWPRWEN